ncbi:MAG: universal stress protein [Bacteroidetes bacterium]|nr:universal stress protein [Bacteroidota bacterium]
MKKFLFPTDFSETALGAFLYALSLAEDMKASVTILHVLPPVVSAHEYYEAENELNLDEKRLDWARKQLINYTHRSEAKHIETDFIIETGIPAVEISRCSKDYDLIVMGTKGARNDANKPFGSVAHGVIEQTMTPVMVIPENNPFFPYEHIMYASEKKMETPENLGFMVHLIDKFHPRISFTHINQESKQNKFVYESVEQVYENDDSSHEIGWYTFNQADVLSGLESFALNKDVDLIVMKTHKRDFLGRIFDDSLSQEMALHTRIPLLVMKDSGV